MASPDAFTQQIIKLVRSMPDDAILALVKNQLGLDGGKGLVSVAAVAQAPKRRGRPPKAAKAAKPVKAAKPAPAPKPAAAPAAPAPKPAAPAKKAAPAKAAKKAAPAKAPAKAAAGRGRPARGGDRTELLNLVERAIKGGNGMAASDVAKAAGIPQSRATAAIKELKLAKRIFQGGDRRFARYAGDARTAQQASENARKTAAGPILKGKKRK
ncbi:MAG: hypothetical protein JNL21_29030 [Myxococcales bacterium]|nr:hypothetical protein [Myxococcales bacterium]